ncbi:hypothetical protein M0R04_07260 [Candidatus Dojkabacteria bacterium]|nr:hypothetical protein [Candidatus Dojkabacteria bacterium]
MNIIRERQAEIRELTSTIKNHPLCLKFKEDSYYYLITYPEGFQLDGCRATHKSCGKIVALTRILNAMERHWEESNINYRF